MNIEFPRQICEKYSNAKIWSKSLQWDPRYFMRAIGRALTCRS